MKKNLCIVPFTLAEYSIILNCPEEYTIKSLVCPKGIGTPAQNVSVLINGYKTNYTFTNSIETGIGLADTVIISSIDKENKALYEFALDALELSINCHKEVISFLNLDDKESAYYQERCKSPDMLHLVSAQMNTLQVEYEKEQKQLHKLCVPVIYFFDLIPNCDSYEIFIKLTSRLQKDGFRVLSVSEDIYNTLWKLDTVNFWENDTSKNLIYHLNQKVYELCQNKLPDVILIKPPNPIMRFDDNNIFDAGLTAFAVSQAVHGDACVCSAYSGTPVLDFWSNICDSIKFKFGLPVLGVHISNQFIDLTTNEYLCTVRVPPEQIKNELQSLNELNELDFYYLLDNKDFERFYQKFRDEFFDFRFGVMEV